MQLKRWERPRDKKRKRNSKGASTPKAVKRKKKQIQMLRKKLNEP